MLPNNCLKSVLYGNDCSKLSDSKPFPLNLLDLIADISAREELGFSLSAFEDHASKISRGDWQAARAFVISHRQDHKIQWSNGSVGRDPTFGEREHG